MKLNKEEKLTDLQYKGLRIIQNKNKFCFGIDAVLLSHFADLRAGDKVADLGTGTGIIPILLSGSELAKSIDGIEYFDDIADMAKRSVLLNNLESTISIKTGDIKECLDFLHKGTYDLVVTNPPYRKKQSGLLNPESSKAAARHELLCTLEDVITASFKLLKNGGRFAMVHRTDRLVDILYTMRKYRIEPKEICLIYPYQNKKPNLVLIKGVKNGGIELKWTRPLIIYNKDGSYTQEIDRIYNGQRIDEVLK